MRGACVRFARRGTLTALAALLALAAPPGAAAQGPAEDAALAFDAAETRVRELERIVAEHAARLGIRPPVAPEPETLEGLARRAAELEDVAGFLAARREVLRIRRRPGVADADIRPLRRGPGDELARLAERLGLDRPSPPTAEGRADDEARIAAVSSWLAASSETPRAAEAPLVWPARGRVIRWGRGGERLDLGLRPGGRVVAAAVGTVADAGGGGVVVIRHAGGLVTAYAGLGAVRVAPGQDLARGEVIGRVAGPRLRFAVRAGGVAVDARDYLRPREPRSAAPPPAKAGPAVEPPAAAGPDCPGPGRRSGPGVRAHAAAPAGFACEPALGGYSRKVSRSSTRTPISSR